MKLYNARSAWEQAMPPMAEAFADFKGFAQGEQRVNRIYDLLTLIIQRYRRPVARRFYPTREMAEFFGVSTFTIATVFRRLHREGLLTLVRGSQTRIPPRAPRTRFAVRGTVVMPIWMPTFLRFTDWRRWFAIVQQELSRYRFVAEPIFFKAGEENQPAFAERVLQFDPDYVLWFCPSTGDMSTLLSLTDTGVPLITVNGERENFPGRVYPLSHDRALQQGLRAWRESGEIDEVIVPLGGEGNMISESLRSTLKNCGLPHRSEVFSGPKSELSKYLARLTSRSRKGILMGDDLFYSSMCIWEPEAVLKLFRRQRAMMGRHVTIPGCKTEGITVDILAFSWPRLARRIALDLSQAKGGIFSRQPIFQADWRARIPLSEVSQSDPVE